MEFDKKRKNERECGGDVTSAPKCQTLAQMKTDSKSKALCSHCSHTKGRYASSKKHPGVTFLPKKMTKRTKKKKDKSEPEISKMLHNGRSSG